MENYQDMQNMNEQQAPAVEPQEAAQEEQGKVVDMAQARHLGRPSPLCHELHPQV